MLTILDDAYEIVKSGKKRKYIPVQCGCGAEFDTRADSLDLNGNCIKCKKNKPFNKTLSSSLDLAKNAIIQAYQDGNSLEEIASVYGTTRHTIRDRLRKWDIRKTKEPRRFGKNHGSWQGYGEISKTFWNQIKIGADTRGIEFNLTIEYIWGLFLKQNRKCSLSGRDINFAKCRTLGDIPTASLDRIDSSKGYIEGNVQWVHKDFNLMKMDFSQEEFIKMCHEVVKIHSMPS